ncbi:MAG: type II toxin-antitoxin system prevent-host-death family antitoxin [Myxococcales bacterium]|nr:type II toxin-antitoxin system prevent-host-death family antitoxin [Myxococcales bacterium]
MKKREAEVSVADAKRQFSHLLGRVAYGKERITIVRRGRPMARLVPAGEEVMRPRLADAKGWLDKDDRFFVEIARLVEARGKHRPRLVTAK